MGDENRPYPGPEHKEELKFREETVQVPKKIKVSTFTLAGADVDRAVIAYVRDNFEVRISDYVEIDDIEEMAPVKIRVTRDG